MSRAGRPRTRGGAAVLLAAALALAPVLAGCEPTQAGSAAVVGDRRITVTELQTATTELRSIVQDPTQISQDLVLGWLIANPYVVKAAADQGKAVSRDDALRFFDQANFAAVDGGTTPSDASIQAVQTAYALQLLTGQGSTAESAKKATDEVLADLPDGGRHGEPPLRHLRLRVGRADPDLHAQPAVLELAAAGAGGVRARPGTPSGQPAPSDQSGQPQGTPSPAAS